MSQEEKVNATISETHITVEPHSYVQGKESKVGDLDRVRAALNAELHMSEQVLHAALFETGMVLSSNEGSAAGVAMAAFKMAPMGIALTTHRMLIVKEKGVFSKSMEAESLPWSRMKTVDLDENVMIAQLIIDETNGHRLVVQGNDKKQIRSLHRYMNEVLDHLANQQSAPSAQASDVADKLAKLADMHRSGLLTDQEFVQLKRRLLGG